MLSDGGDVFSRLRKQARKQHIECVHWKAQRDEALRCFGAEQACIDDIAEHAACRPVGQARDPRNLAALIPATVARSLHDRTDRLGLQAA
jgi:hypothetical protein